MKKSMFILFVFLHTFISGQESASILGFASELESGEAVLFATVALYQDDKLITGTETDFDGMYAFNGLEPGNYGIEISFLGKKTVRKSDLIIEAGDNFIDFEMEDDLVLLEEIVITGYNPLLRACCCCCYGVATFKDDSDSEDIVITTILDYDKPNHEESAPIYPNPASRQVTIRNEIEADAIDIINAMGQQVYFKNEIKGDVVSLSVADFQNGMYYVRYLADNNIVKSEALTVISKY